MFKFASALGTATLAFSFFPATPILDSCRNFPDSPSERQQLSVYWQEVGGYLFEAMEFEHEKNKEQFAEYS